MSEILEIISFILWLVSLIIFLIYFTKANKELIHYEKYSLISNIALCFMVIFMILVQIF